MKRTLHPLVFVLALVLAPAVGLVHKPASLWAAPVIQAEELTIIGFYQSDVLPVASSPGLQISLTLYDDGSAEVASDYLNDEPPIIEIGEWVQNDDGSVTLTVTGTDAGPYAEPITLTFELADDGSLVIPGEEGGPFGREGLILAPAEPPTEAEPAEAETPTAETPTAETTAAAATPGPTRTPTGQATPEPDTAETAEAAATATPTAGPEEETPAEAAPTAEATEAAEETPTEEAPTEQATPEPVGEPVGAYISEILPAADAPGLVIMAVLYENGYAMVSSFYLNGEPPIIEVGSWAESISGGITLTATGTLEAEYDEPTSADFEVDEDGSLVAGGVVLSRLEELAADTAEDASVYQTGVMTSTASAGLQITLTLYTDGSAEMVSDYMNGEAPFVDLGVWTDNGDGTLTLTLTGSPEGDYDEPVDLVFEVRDDGGLSAVEYPVEVFGEAGLEFSPVEGTGAAAAPGGATGDATGDATGEATGEDTPAEEPAGGEPSGVQPTPEAAATDEATTGEPAAEESTAGEVVTSAGGQIYQSEALPAASGPGRQITLALAHDGSAVMSTDYMNDEPPITELGEWVEGDDGAITVTLTEGPLGPYEDAQVIVFEVTDEGGLRAVEYDVTVFGQNGLELSPIALE
ncbi:MAG TPA: copper resistance protein NlpE N-terminal domain-containing protein [Caldilineaceae bacterium]|nr:copper resistance protein NlpE N-terminal domain-containing protein [Caldilineaceae bacterium]